MSKEQKITNEYVFSSVAMAIGIICIFACLWDIEPLGSVFPHWPTTNISGVFMIFVLGYCCFSFFKNNTQYLLRLKNIGASLCAFLSLFILTQYLFRIDININPFSIFNVSNPFLSSHWYDNPPLIVSLCTFMLSAAYLCRLKFKFESMVILSELLLFSSFALMLPAFIGYLYGVTKLFSIHPYMNVGIPTCLAVIFLSVSQIISLPHRKITSVFTSSSKVSHRYRYLLLILVFMPIALGWICLQGELQGFYDAKFSLALIVIMGVGTAFLISLIMMNQLNQDEEVLMQRNSKISEKEIQFQRLADSMPQLVWTANREGQLCYMNKRFEEFTGFSAASMKVEYWEKLVPVASQKKIDQAWASARASNTDFEVEFDMFDQKTNTHKWFLSRGSPVLDVSGNIENWYGTTTDITDQKKMFDQINLSECRLNTIIQQAPIGIQIVSPQGFITQVNEAWKKIWNVTEAQLKEEILGKYNIFEDSKLEANGILTQIKNAMKGEQVVVPSLHHYNPEDSGFPGRARIIDVCISPIKNSEGQVVELFIAFTDVTNQVEAAHKIQAKQQKLQAVLDNSPNMILMKDLDGRMLLVNKVFREIFNTTDEKIIGKSSEDIWPKDIAAKFIENDQRVINLKSPIREEVSTLHPDGRHTYLSIKFPIFDENKNVKGIGEIATDITDIKATQNAKVKAEIGEMSALETSRLKSEFLANMSHEIRTPIHGIIGMTQMLADSKINEEQKSFIEAITSSSKLLLNLVNDILDISKIEAGYFELEMISFSLDVLIDDIKKFFSPLMRNKDISFIINMDEKIKGQLYEGDPTRLQQILNNLITNALKFTDHGSVTLNISIQNTVMGSSELEFSVTDTGIGISPAVIGRLFKNFSQGDASTARKFGGTGLGLSISKHLVDAMGGSIGVKSQVGQGTTFYFSFNLKHHEINNIPALSQDSQPNLKALTLEQRAQKNILIAEDNPINREILVRMLAKNGFVFDAVENGLQVLALAKQKVYDLILMDCQMPEMDGYEATSHLRSQGFVNPIIALTADALKDSRENCKKFGRSDYFAKPFQEVRLIMTMDRLLSDNSNIIDWSAIQTLEILEEQSKMELLPKLVEIYDKIMHEGFEKLKSLAGTNTAEVQKVGHYLVSSNANLGLKKTTFLLQRVAEEAFQQKEFDQILYEISNEVKVAKKVLQNYLDSRVYDAENFK